MSLGLHPPVSKKASAIARHGGIAPTRWNRAANDAYFTIDAPWIIPALLSKVKIVGPVLEPAAGVDRAPRGKENASDHAPVWVELRDVAPQVSRTRPARSPASARAGEGAQAGAEAQRGQVRDVDVEDVHSVYRAIVLLTLCLSHAVVPVDGASRGNVELMA